LRPPIAQMLNLTHLTEHSGPLGHLGPNMVDEILVKPVTILLTYTLVYRTVHLNKNRFCFRAAQHMYSCKFQHLEGLHIHTISVAEPHHFYAAPAPTLLHSKAKFLKRTKV
jgi:hypothetical protein